MSQPPLDNQIPVAVYLQCYGQPHEKTTVESCEDKPQENCIRYVQWSLVEDLLSDIIAAHSDPCSGQYNECDTKESQCDWCRKAEKLFPNKS